MWLQLSCVIGAAYWCKLNYLSVPLGCYPTKQVLRASIRCFVIVVLQSKTLILKARLWFHKVDMGLCSCMDKM